MTLCILLAAFAVVGGLAAGAGFYYGRFAGWAQANATAEKAAADYRNKLEIAKTVKTLRPWGRRKRDETCTFGVCPNYGKPITDPCPIRLCDH
jgi:type II secretory pathway pseudopilin PulG